MNIPTNWISPDFLRLLGWTLLHFLWQGAALAAALYVMLAAFRSASTRYALSVATLILMLAAPILTFTWLSQHPEEERVTMQTNSSAPLLAVHQRNRHRNEIVAPQNIFPQQANALFLLVEIWFAGVVLLSLRTAGGLLLLEKMRRADTKPVSRELYDRCIALQRRVGLDRVIRYCECHRLDAPAVIGWFRPMVLLPITALSGLTEAQLEAVIAHELAHIRRLDCFVNLFQIAVETLLFYHPADWWVNRRIRMERENCCDDAAITAGGDAVEYARALALMEESRTAPILAMAANGSPLGGRIARLLGLSAAGGNARVAGLAVSIVCLTTALLAGSACLRAAHASVPQDQSSGNAIVVTPAPTAPLAPLANPAPVPTAANLAPTAAAAARPVVALAPVAALSYAVRIIGSQAGSQEKKNVENQEAAGSAHSYVADMDAAGFKNLSVDELIAMKVQGITPDYVKSIQALGFKPDPDELIAIKVQGITAEYIRDMRAIFKDLSLDDLIGMKVQGITPEYNREIHELGLQADAGELIGMKVQGITPEYVREIRATGLKPDTDDLIGMKVQGVTPEFIKALQSADLGTINIDDVIGAKVQGITPEYIKSVQSAGLGKISIDDLISAKVQGVTPEFIEQARKHGFKDLSLEKLIALKIADVL